ncbi:unnamed protein product [Strongylus vulgaris]|uniref:Alpha-carbonic anhydrase domain-containing protein n=1 Tax=Strongylus vulgaris TaxID=40348 RepID=A0A3P7JXD2_STRVU|nr:unnamed protein product [Strongylus vulgaris]
MLPWLMTACIYPCVVGPDFWGLVNRDWRMCTAGQMQSPVNIDPAQLLFDPHLGRISIDNAYVQLLAYNIDLYTNYSQAVTQPRGLLAISVIVDIGDITEVALRRLTVASQSITYKGMKTTLRQLHPAGLLPRTHHYVTYEGSLTIPGCHETVTWIIMNNPIYITREDLQIWNELQKTETKQADPAYMTPAYRPLKALNGRLLRTNINVSYKQTSASTCSSNIYTEMGYRSNPARARHNQSIAKRSVPYFTDQREIFELEAVEPEQISISTLNTMQSV